MQLKIDEEFRNLIPPMQADELSSLRESISREGCRDALIVWGGVLVDGHNRYAICTELGKPFNTKEITFADRDEVKIWIIRNQFSRRNLNDFQRVELGLKLEPLLKKQAVQKQRAGGEDKVPQKSAKPIDVRQEVAKAAGVSHDTVGKVRKIVNSPVKELAHYTREGKVSINAAAKVAELPEKEQREAVEAGPEAVKDAAKCEPQKRCKPKARGKALEYGYKAIEILKSIPSDDGLHDEALSLVERWCAHNKKGN
jgi:ParB-like chromosome segregation protein Spo0J